MRDGDKVLGLTGAGLDVGGFLRDFVNSGQAGVTPIIVDETGAIQAHMDPTLIAYNSGAGGADGRGMVFSLLDPGRGARNCARPCTRRRPIHSRCSRPVAVDGHRQLVSVAYMPELHWHVLTLVDLGAARVLDTGWIWPVAVGLVLLFAAMLLCFGYAVERLMLRRCAGCSNRPAPSPTAAMTSACRPEARTRSAISAMPSASWPTRCASTRPSSRARCASAPRSWKTPTAPWPPRTRRSATPSTTPA